MGAWFWATLGNTLGSMTSYVLGRFMPRRKELSPKEQLWHTRLQKWGTPLLILSWLPFIGDFLPVAAGWLRFSVWTSFIWIAIGKALRYAFLVMLTFGYMA